MNASVDTKKSALNLANKITIGRILLIPVFVILILSYENSRPPEAEWLRITAILVFVLAILTDAVDGFIARTRGQKTPLGTFLDPLADKLLLTSAIILLTMPNLNLGYRLPLWFTVLALSRDLFITLGALLIHILNGSVRIIPSLFGKLTTFSQMVVIVWVLLKLPHPEIWVYLAALLTFVSGIGYLIFASRQLNGNLSKSP
jgi:CDP-diacylglycerol--glycerol-3-phosphate 3-phosphatidyltransferase